MINLKLGFVIYSMSFLMVFGFSAQAGSNDWYTKVKKEEINEKVRTFCSSSAYIEERCEKYCIDLRDWHTWEDKWYKYWNSWELEGGWFHNAGATALCNAPNSTLNKSQSSVLPKPSKPKDNKKIIKNDDGTETKVTTKFKNGNKITISITKDVNGKEVKEEVVEEIKNNDGSQEIITKTTSDEKKEAITIFIGENEKRTKEEIRIKTGVGSSEEKTEVRTIYLDENENVLEIFVENENSDGEKSIISQNAYNKKLEEHVLKLSNDSSVNFLIKSGEIEDSKVLFDEINNEVFIYSENVLMDEFKKDSDLNFKIKVSKDKFLISDSSSEFLVKESLLVGNESGKVYIKTGEKENEFTVDPSLIYEDVKGRLNESYLTEIVDNDGLKFKTSGRISKKFLWFFDIELESNVYHNFSDGSFMSQENQGLLNKFKIKLGIK